MTPAGWLWLMALGIHWAPALGEGWGLGPTASNTGCRCSSECGTSLFEITKWCWVDAGSCDANGCLCRTWLFDKWDYCNEPNRYVGRKFHERQVGLLEQRLQRAEQRELRRLKKDAPQPSTGTADADTQTEDTWSDHWDTPPASSHWVLPLVWSAFLCCACLRHLRRPAPERAPLAADRPEPSAPPYWAVSQPPPPPPSQAGAPAGPSARRRGGPAQHPP